MIKPPEKHTFTEFFTNLSQWLDLADTTSEVTTVLDEHAGKIVEHLKSIEMGSMEQDFLAGQVLFDVLEKATALAPQKSKESLFTWRKDFTSKLMKETGIDTLIDVYPQPRYKKYPPYTTYVLLRFATGSEYELLPAAKCTEEDIDRWNKMHSIMRENADFLLAETAKTQHKALGQRVYIQSRTRIAIYNRDVLARYYKENAKNPDKAEAAYMLAVRSIEEGERFFMGLNDYQRPILQKNYHVLMQQKAMALSDFYGWVFQNNPDISQRYNFESYMQEILDISKKLKNVEGFGGTWVTIFEKMGDLCILEEVRKTDYSIISVKEPFILGVFAKRFYNLALEYAKDRRRKKSINTRIAFLQGFVRNRNDIPNHLNFHQISYNRVIQVVNRWSKKEVARGILKRWKLIGEKLGLILEQ